MSFDRSTRSLFATLLATAAVFLGVNVLVRPDGLTDSMGLLTIILLVLAFALWAWNWREASLAERATDEQDEQDDAIYGEPMLPVVTGPALQPAFAAPAVTLTDEAELAAAEAVVMPTMVVPDIPAVPEPVTPPAPIAPPVPAPEPVTPPAPEPAAPPAPEPETPPAPAPVEPPVPSPAEPPVPAPAEPAPADENAAAPVVAAIPPAEQEAPQPIAPEGVADLREPEVKESAPEPDAPETVDDAKNGEPVAARVVGEAMAAPEQPDQAEAENAVSPGESATFNAAAPDNFTRIEGIGKYYQDALTRVGYTTFAQLAADTPETILGKLLAGGYRRHPTIPTWPEQAALAAQGDWDGLTALQKTLISGRRA